MVETPRTQTCQPCRIGEHIDHHRGVWRRADGSDPVICRCARCEPGQPGEQMRLLPDEHRDF